MNTNNNLKYFYILLIIIVISIGLCPFELANLHAQPLLFKKNISNNSSNSRKEQTSIIHKINEPHSKNEVLIKIKKDFLTNCGKQKIEIDEINQALKSFSIKNINAKFHQENKRFFPDNKSNFENNPLEGIYSIKFSKDIDIEKVLDALNKLPQIEYAEFIKTYQTLYQPNDPLADSLLSDSVLSGKINYLTADPNQYYLGSIKAYQAWNITKGDTNVLIGIIDTGFDTTNIELKSNIKRNFNDPIDGIDNDGNGYTDDYWGWNTALGNGNIQSNQSDLESHGTRVAGLAGANTDDNLGLAGVGFKCKLVPVKISNGSGLQSPYDGIYYCVKRGCKVINCSWGGMGSYQQSEQDIINYAIANGAVITASAGNGDGRFYNETPYYPATYKNVLSVSQCLPDGKSFLAGVVNAVTYNNYVDVVAPGISIFTLYFNRYNATTGTSLASPIVAGLTGLVWSRFPNYTPKQIMEQVRVSTDYTDSILANSNVKEKMGSGMVNAFRAVTDTTLKSARWESDSIQNVFLGKSGNAFEGDTMRISGQVVNYLKPTSNLMVKISTTSTYLIVTDSIINFGSIGTLNNKWNSRNPFKIYIKPGSPKSFSATLRVGFSDGSYNDYQYITINGINPEKIYPTYLDLNVNQIAISVGNTGRFAFLDDDANATPSKGIGYKYLGGYHRAWEMGLLVGLNSTKVSDCIRGVDNGFGQQFKDTDFKIASQISYTNGPGIQNIKSSFSDSTATNPIGIKISQNSYGWNDNSNNRYYIIEYTIENNSTANLDSLCVGLFTDWSVYNNIRTRAQWDANISTGITVAASVIPYLNGIQVLYPTQKPAHAIFNYSSPANGINIYDGFTESEKFKFMSNGILNQSAGVTGLGIYMGGYVGTTLYNFESGSKRTVAFAILNGISYTDITNVAKQSLNKFKGVKSGPKPQIDSLFTVCKGNSLILSPTGNSLYNLYDTIPGTKSPLFSKLRSFTVGGFNQTKYFYITNADSIFEGVAQKITVQIDTIKSSYTYTLSTQTPKTAIFNSTSTGISYNWDFQDGNWGMGANNQHTYSASGTYFPKLILTNALGCKDTFSRAVNIPVYIPSPKPNIDSQQFVCQGLLKILKPSGGLLFNFYDTIPGLKSPLASSVGSYTTPGINGLQTYYITNVDSIFEGPYQKVEISISTIRASFDFNISASNPLSVDFLSTTPGNLWEWELGDGVTGTGANFVHTYSTTGTFPVKMKTYNNFGCSDSIQVPVLIQILTNLEKAALDKIILSPNPANDFIQIESSGLLDDLVEIKFINAVGQNVLNSKIKISNKTILSILSIPSGVYTIIIQNGNSASAKKISIVR